ncbi:YggT family protein [Inmirania thermothiophila]|uniref:YggT family protein n=1 Tax=Inmirania thermothiophila TaxID=1750597 RepID=A0A3N1Y7J7_9GAMM|nr:YggT family protein [Inmirania thermothiophila]ROR34488.1 YggT family protein [Inmirania thermothiophila]
MNPYLASPLEFLIQTVAGLYVLALMLRFLLAWVRADFYNPLSQFLVRITSPPLRPLRRIVPPLGGIDLAALVLMLAVQFAALALIVLLRGGPLPVGALLAVSLAELVRLAINVFFFAILIQAVLSWVNPGLHNPLTSLLHSLTEPVLRPIRRFVPVAGGIDFSPLVAMIALELAKRLILPPLLALAG